MGRYIVKRLLYLIPMLFCVVLLVFLIMSLTPGNPADNILPMTATQEAKQAFNEKVGFTGSLAHRFLLYLKGLLGGNILSYSSQNNIFDEIALRFPITLRLGLISFSIAVIIGVLLGILSAVKQYSFIDTLPSFGLNDGVRSYILPVTTLVLANVPFLSRMTRSAMLETLYQDYIRTARAKGCSEKRVIWKHAFKNASLPIITLVLTGLASILGGAVITETIFTIPGIGTYMLDGIMNKDVPVVMTCALLLAFIFMIAMVLLDIFYALIDPRIRARYQ